jgi:hypothetical protein
MHGRLLLFATEVSRSDGVEFLLHQPLDEGHFELRRAPDTVSLDVIVPPLTLARLYPNATTQAAFQEVSHRDPPPFTYRAQYMKGGSSR